MGGNQPIKVDIGDGDVIEITPLARPAFARLLDAHPAPADSDGLWAETFPPALIAACTGFTVEEATEWWDETTSDSALILFEECHRACYPGSYDAAVHVLRTNERRLLEVRAAMRAGISYDAFMEWSPRSQDMALAFMTIEADVCAGCGVPKGDVMDRGAWKPDVYACVHCRNMDATRDKISDEDRGSTHVRLVRK